MSDSHTKRPPQQHAPATPPQPEAAEAPAVTTAEPPVTASPSRTTKRASTGSSDPFAAFDAARTAFAGSTVAVADEMAGLMRLGIDSATDAATGLLAAKTLGDAFAVNAGLASRNLDAALARSLRLSEIGTRLAAEAWEKLMPMFGAAPIR